MNRAPRTPRNKISTKPTKAPKVETKQERKKRIKKEKINIETAGCFEPDFYCDPNTFRTGSVEY